MQRLSSEDFLLSACLQQLDLIVQASAQLQMVCMNLFLYWLADLLLVLVVSFVLFFHLVLGIVENNVIAGSAELIDDLISHHSINQLLSLSLSEFLENAEKKKLFCIMLFEKTVINYYSRRGMLKMGFFYPNKINTLSSTWD